jgi:hypothetical protein
MEGDNQKEVIKATKHTYISEGVAGHPRLSINGIDCECTIPAGYERRTCGGETAGKRVAPTGIVVGRGTEYHPLSERTEVEIGEELWRRKSFAECRRVGRWRQR